MGLTLILKRSVTQGAYRHADEGVEKGGGKAVILTEIRDFY